MHQRSILCDFDIGFAVVKSTRGGESSNQKTELPPVKSPIVNTLVNPYAQSCPAPRQGVLNVMYAPAGQGKTFVARSVLEHGCEFRGRR